MKQMEAIKCGSLVKTKVGNFDGIIVRFDTIIYEVTMTDGNKLITDELREQEFDVQGRIEKIKIGFKV